MTGTEQDQLLELARSIVRTESLAVAEVADQLDESFLSVARLLLDCRGKVFVTGSGTSAAVARRMAHLLSVCGTPSVYLQPMDALHGTMGAVTGEDVVVAISHGGGSTEINELVTRVKERGATTVAITARPESVLGRHSDLVVELVSRLGADPGDVIAMGSTLMVSAWGDALAVVLMQLREYTWEQVLHSHPAGAVGTIVHNPGDLDGLDARASVTDRDGEE